MIVRVVDTPSFPVARTVSTCVPFARVVELRPRPPANANGARESLHRTRPSTMKSTFRAFAPFTEIRQGTIPRTVSPCSNEVIATVSALGNANFLTSLR